MSPSSSVDIGSPNSHVNCDSSQLFNPCCCAFSAIVVLPFTDVLAHFKLYCILPFGSLVVSRFLFLFFKELVISLQRILKFQSAVCNAEKLTFPTI